MENNVHDQLHGLMAQSFQRTDFEIEDTSESGADSMHWTLVDLPATTRVFHWSVKCHP